MKPNKLSSRLFDRNTSATVGTARAAKYHRHVDCADHSGGLNPSTSKDSLQIFDCSKQDKSFNRDNHFLFLPEMYKPLIDEEAQIKKKEEKKMKKEKYKKVKKNVGKALRSTWKCLMLGLYNFALGYSTPITVAATFVPDFHPGKNRT